MRKVLLGVGALAVAISLSVTTASAAPFTSHFAALAIELQTRAASPDTTPAQQKAVRKALSKLDKPSASLGTDVRTAGKIAKLLAKAFADEFAGATGLGTMVTDLVSALRGDVAEVVAALAAKVGALPTGSCATKATQQLDKATAALVEATGTDAVALARDLAKTLKAAARGDKIGSKCTGGGGGECTDTNSLVVTVDGVEWTPVNAGFFRSTDVNSLVVLGNDPGPPGSSISIVVHGVNGTGTFDVEPGCDYVRDGDPTFSVPSGSTAAGTLTLEGFTYSDDFVVNDCFRGSFDVTFTNGAASKRVQGTFDLSKLPSL